MSAVVEVARLRTDPGAEGVLAPPRGWNGGPEDYKALLRARFAPDQRRGEMLDLARYSQRLEVVVSGPFADQAVTAVRAVAARQGGSPSDVVVASEPREETGDGES